MSSSCSSSGTSTGSCSGSCSCPSNEPEVAVDDAAAVVAGLSGKFLKLRREILALKDSPGSARSKGRAGYGGPETVRNKMATREPFRREDYFPRGRNHSQLIGKKASKSRREGLLRKAADLSSSTTSSSRDVRTAERRTLSDETRNVSFALGKRRQRSTAAPSGSDEFLTPDDELTTGRASSVSSGRINRAKSKDETFHENSRKGKKLGDSDTIKSERSFSESSDGIHSDKSANDNSRRISEGRGKDGTSGIVKKIKSLSRYSAGGIRSYKPETGSAGKNYSERKKHGASGRVFTEKTRPASSRRSETHATLRRRRTSRGDQDGRFGTHQMAYSSGNSNGEEPAKKVLRHETNRIALPSRVSTKCQGIRHAFGLSNAYCNCDHTGSAARRVRKKKVSRGVQCDSPKYSGCRSHCGLGRCFGLRRRSKKSRKSRRKNAENSAEKMPESAESSEIYRPKRSEPAKEACAIEKNDLDRSRDKREAKNRRMSGGAEEINSRRFESAGVFPRKSIDGPDGEPRRWRGTRRRCEAPANRWVNKNDVTDVRRRLNECLLELNGIIGDVGSMF